MKSAVLKYTFVSAFAIAAATVVCSVSAQAAGGDAFDAQSQTPTQLATLSVGNAR